MARPGYLGRQPHLRLLREELRINCAAMRRRRVRRSGPAALFFGDCGNLREVLGTRPRHRERGGAQNRERAVWAKIGVPMDLVMLGIYFAVIKLLG